MTEIPSDILDIAAVVTGTAQLPLSGRPRVLAIQAMHALDRRLEFMQAALCLKRRWQLLSIARRAGIDLQQPDPLDEWAVVFACQGTPMRLDNAERDEVIRRVGWRHSAVELGRLCGQPAGNISTAAIRLGVALRKPHENCWWHSYVEGGSGRERVMA